MAFLLFPIHGTVLVIDLIALAIVVVALLDVLTHPGDAFVDASQISKTFWIMGFVLGAFVTLPGAIAAFFYFLEVRPALQAAQARAAGGGSGGGSRGGDKPRPTSRR
jgi:Protein of unknown function (DUF2516)